MALSADFLADLEESDLAGWRALPASKLLVEHLQREIAAAKDVIPAHVEDDEQRLAAIATGGLRACESLLACLFPPERAKPEPEQPFVDPAAIVRPPQGLKVK